jgi:hypothetical protein
VAIELLALAVGMTPDEPAAISTDGLLLQSAVTRIYATFANHAIPYTRSDAEVLLELAATAMRAGRRNGIEWMALELVPQPIAVIERVVKDGGIGELGVSIQEAAELLSHLGATTGRRPRALPKSPDGAPRTETAPDGHVRQPDSWVPRKDGSATFRQRSARSCPTWRWAASVRR